MVIRCLTALVLAIALAAPAPGAKWVNGCPQVGLKLSQVGKPWKSPAGEPISPFRANPYAYSRYFEHVGHELTFHLRDTVVAHGGGFSTDPGGNTLEVTFTPLGKDSLPIPLPPVPVTATSPTSLTVVVPDTRPILGRLVVGPARFVVKRGGQGMFEATRQIILPPMNDVQALTQQGAAVEVLAAMDKRANLWIPLGFSAFGQGESLPECPTVLTPVTAFAVEFDLKKGDDQAFPYVSFGNLKKNLLYLGDYILFGDNMYGSLLRETKLDVTPLAQKGVVLCARNDALQIIVKIGLRNPALGDKSELLALARDGSPQVVKIENVSLDPQVASVLERLDHDSVNLPCYPAE